MLRIVLTNETGNDEIFSGNSVLSVPPSGDAEEEAPETLRSPISVIPSSRRDEPVVTEA